jgi:hypothetical protein
MREPGLGGADAANEAATGSNRATAGDARKASHPN